MAGVEFDLAGERVNLGGEELEWLLAQARDAAGRSAAAGELATMLAEVPSGARRRRGPIALQRGERRAIRALLGAGSPPGRGLDQLRLLLERDRS